MNPYCKVLLLCFADPVVMTAVLVLYTVLYMINTTMRPAGKRCLVVAVLWVRGHSEGCSSAEHEK